jgi:capsular exopolysaccharide synthesis family protein
VVCAAIAAAIFAFGYSYLQTPLYAASAKLMYENQLNVADPLSTTWVDASQRQAELVNVASVIESPDLIKSARVILGGGAVPSYMVETVWDAESSSSSGQSDVSTISIRAISADAETSARVANAYAQAFTAYRRAREQSRVRQAEQVVKSRMDTFTTEESKQTAEYLTLQQRLQDLQILEATATGNFTILAPATAPEAPFAPRPVRNGLIGLFAGMVVGTGIALIVAQFDTRVRSQEEVVELLDMPLWGQIRKMPKRILDDDPLVVTDESQSWAAESFRKLRASLEFANVDHTVRSLFITSALQHEGKSVTVCNLALALAEAGSRVVLVDGDLRRPQVHKHFRVKNGVGLSLVLTGRVDLETALSVRTIGRRLTARGQAEDSMSGQGSLSILPSGPVPPNPAELIASRSFQALVDRLETEFDMVIIDAPALLAVSDTSAMARCVDGLVFLVNLTLARRPILQEALTQLSQMPCQKLGLVTIAPAPRRADQNRYGYYSHEPAARATFTSAADARTEARV